MTTNISFVVVMAGSLGLGACNLGTFGPSGDATTSGPATLTGGDLPTSSSTDPPTTVDSSTSSSTTSTGDPSGSSVGLDETSGATDITTTSATSGPPPSTCNNGVLEDGEDCDDGDDDPLDGCTPACTPTRAIALGIGPISYHTCVLLPDGGARCWGYNPQGQLGGAPGENIGDDEFVYWHPALAAPGKNGTRFDAIAGGERHACALTSEDHVFCWGSQIEGRTGDGHYSDCSQPNTCKTDYNMDTLLLFGSLGPAEYVDFGFINPLQLAVGQAHACVATEDGDVRCWGQNVQGQLGLGHDTCVGTTCIPDIVAVELGSIPGPVVQLAAGGYHTCVRFDAPSDNVQCWGRGVEGQLGYGNTKNVGDGEMDSPDPAIVGPLQLGGQAIDLATGNGFTCVVLDTGSVRCWGENENGQLGQGNATDLGNKSDSTPNKIPDIALDRGVRKIRCGNQHVCALNVDDTVTCWGLGLYGALGYGNQNDVSSPGDVGIVDVGAPVLDIALGEQHTCVLLKDTTEIRCWGDGTSGQLGYGDAENIGDDPGETPASAGNVPFYAP